MPASGGWLAEMICPWRRRSVPQFRWACDAGVATVFKRAGYVGGGTCRRSPAVVAEIGLEPGGSAADHRAAPCEARRRPRAAQAVVANLVIDADVADAAALSNWRWLWPVVTVDGASMVGWRCRAVDGLKVEPMRRC